ncbi:MAG: cell division protein ZapA [Steroidobacteraceae bacterium]
MSNDSNRVSVKILEKEYHVACPPEQQAALVDSASLLNKRMKEIRDSGKVVGLDRIAVMAALNIANELLAAKGRGELEAGMTDRIRGLRERVEAALAAGRQLEL